MPIYRRLLCLLIAICLIFTQTAQAYSQARLPYKYQHTNKARTEGSNQSYNRSSLTSNSGNLSILAGGNLIASGTDFAADNGELALNAGGAVALLAGQDILNQSSSSKTVTQDNIFTKQRHTITDTYASLDYQGSTLKGKAVKINSGGDTILQATTVTAGKGGITIDAGGDLKLLAAANQQSRTHTETLATDGYTFRADSSLNDTDTRRMNNKHEDQTQTNLVVSLVSEGDITTKSGGDTLIEASDIQAEGAVDVSATGYAAAVNEDGTLKYAGRDGTVTFAAIRDSSYINNVNSSNSMPWQSSSGNGEMVETIKLANIKAGKGLTIDAKGGIIVDIPEVPAEAPAPAEPEEVVIEEPIPSVGPDGKPLSQEEIDAIVAERAAKAAAKAAEKAEKAIQAEAARKLRAEQRFTDHINALASQPGQEWIGQLAKQAKEQPDSVKLQQVNAALEKWDYAHDGLTPEATAVIVIVVTYFTAGSGSGIASSGGASVASATGSAALGAAATAAITTLASQAVLAIINNKGNVGKALDDMGKSENVKALALAMVTAGVLQGLDATLGIEKINAQSSFGQQLGKNIINQSTSAVLNHAINGGDLQQMLEQSLKSAFIDTGAAQSANWIGDMKGKELNNFTHKLAHAIAGCAIGAAKTGDCSNGALGAVVGELSAELYAPNSTTGMTPEQINQMKTDTINFAKMMAGVAAAITGGDAEAINLAANTGGNAAENNRLLHFEEVDFLADKERIKRYRERMAQLGYNMTEVDAAKALNRFGAAMADEKWAALNGKDSATEGFIRGEAAKYGGSYLDSNGTAHPFFATTDAEYKNETLNLKPLFNASVKNSNVAKFLADNNHPSNWAADFRVGQIAGQAYAAEEGLLGVANNFIDGILGIRSYVKDSFTSDEVGILDSEQMAVYYRDLLKLQGRGQEAGFISEYSYMNQQEMMLLGIPAAELGGTLLFKGGSALMQAGKGWMNGGANAVAKVGDGGGTVATGSGSLKNGSGSTSDARNAARNQPYVNGSSASPAPGPNAAGSSGGSIDWLKMYDDLGNGAGTTDVPPLFRGTSEGYPGSPGMQAAGVTSASTDPAVATVFATGNATTYGNGVVHIATAGDLAGVDILPAGNISAGSLPAIEAEVAVGVPPLQFASQSSVTITAAQARTILANMGINVPSTINLGNTTSTLLDIPKLTPAQVLQFVNAAKSMEGK